MILVGVDVGGTFTDIVLYDADSGAVHVHKVPSTPDDPSRAVMSGIVGVCAIAGIAPSAIHHVFHGTTVATNAAIQHRGVVAGMITTAGFRDIIHIGRHQRPQHYSIQQDIPWQSRPLVKRRHRMTVAERLVPPTGDVLVPLDEEAVRAAARQLRDDGVEAIAICFLFAHLNPIHEQRAKTIVEAEYPEAFVTCSHEVSPQFREFERFTTTAMNAFIGPLVRDYVRRLEAALAEAGCTGGLSIMASNGGVASPALIAERPVVTLMSGLAAGVLGCARVGAEIGRNDLISLDIGGTSADIGVVTGGRTAEASARDTYVAGFPILIPMIDLHTIGAGGGSLARRDAAGAFRVGPESAGAVPGPAAYGAGGTEATVTDANIVLGRLDEGGLLGGDMKLDRAAAQAAVQRLADVLGLPLLDAAEGVIAVLNANMASAIRARTVQKGIDPRRYALAAAGGAGPLHGAEVARLLDIGEVIVPPYPGLTSAMGLLTTDIRYDVVRTVLRSVDEVSLDWLGNALEAMDADLAGRFERDDIASGDTRLERQLDLRYAGQGYELRVPLGDGAVDKAALEAASTVFHELHEAEYGHAFRGLPIEIVNVRLVGTGIAPKIGAMTTLAGRMAHDARLRSRPVMFRVGQALQSFETTFYRRDALPVGQDIKGPAVVLQRDSTTVVPPDCDFRQEESGSLVIRIGVQPVPAS
ncbi:MAG: hydantoinase/oxoprolinase family protein [Pseudomonadota bacterium]|nr:hydantoinase/oxoprolinase family protein [Pseudomonadota bacterium]